MPMAAIGIGLSIYQASQASKAAHQAQSGEEQALGEREALAREQRDRYESLYGPMERHLISEATSDAPTQTYNKGLSDYEWGLGNVRRKLNATQMGGLRASGLQGLDLQEAQTRSGMLMQDKDRKLRMQEALLSQGKESPGYFRAQDAVAGSKMGYYQRLNDIMRNNESNSWGAAARGMYSLGQSFGGQDDDNAPETPLPSVTGDTNAPLQDDGDYSAKDYDFSAPQTPQQ